MRVFRWLAPLTAAAAAVVIWVVVPIRPITPPVEPERAAQSAGLDSRNQDRQLNPQPGTRQADSSPEAQMLKTDPGTPNPEAGTSNPLPPPQVQYAPRIDAPQTDQLEPTQDLERRAGAAQKEFSADTAVTSASPLALDSATRTIESVSPSSTLIRWRILQSTPASVERSTDGGRTWALRVAPAPSLDAIRAVDSARAAARSSDESWFYTTNGGLSWTRVQENSAAPF